jgi:FKBP-type peptidyl-prolyl cis-trans isomerase FkpA
MKNIFYLLSILISLSSCDTYSEEDRNNFDLQIAKYLKKNDIKCEHSESGLYYHIYNPGEGETIQFTDIVSFSYKGTLTNGTVFDNQKKPIDLAVKDLIAGWKEIMVKLKPGAKVFLAIPPSLGYGDHDLDKIPPNSILLFEMEINAVQ